MGFEPPIWILHFLLKDLSVDDLPYLQDALFIQDNMVLFHALTSLPPTCEEICLHDLDHMAAKKSFIFSTNTRELYQGASETEAR